MGYEFWKWVYELAKVKMHPYRSRKCENCLRWDTEACCDFVRESKDRMFEVTRCAGCGKETRWFMGGMGPMWASKLRPKPSKLVRVSK